MSKKLLSLTLLLFAFFLTFYFQYNYKPSKQFDYHPSDWFYYQRAYPNVDIDFNQYFEAVKQYEQMKLRVNKSMTKSWQAIGPFNIGGRITSIDVDPTNKDIIYIGAAAGGLFKSTDGGNSWRALTDFYPSLSSGVVKVDPNNPNIIYFGSGEANSSGDSYPGFGMLKSTDGGENWFKIGLDSSRHISKMEIHPLNSNLIFVAVAGGLYSKSQHRGIYRSEDGGLTWERVLFLNDSTSAIDVAIDPNNMDIVYAVMWERMRSPTYRKAAGIWSGIYKSTNKGNTWTQLTNGLPYQQNNIGRITIAVSKSNPNYIYALYRKSSTPNGSDNVFEGFYRSTTQGNSWTKMTATGISGFASFGWYFGMMEVDPIDPSKVYLGDIDIFKTTNGGNSFTNITNSYSGSFLLQHPDQHALWIEPANPNLIYNGNDGGFFVSTNQGINWIKKFDLPISQFYASTIDFQLPYRKYGGTQDNGTLGTKTGALDDWKDYYGGDGFYCLVDYTNSDILYMESQYGVLGKSTDGGNNFISARNGIISSDRFNWSTPFIMDEVNPNILFYGSHRVYMTTNGALNWTAISGDLTRGPNGRLGTISTLSSCALQNGDRVIYVGTDDAKVWVSKNTGANWIDITGTLPNRYVTRVECDKRNPAIAYVTLSGYNLDKWNPHIFRTTDYGQTWNDISSNLPDVPVNDIVIDYNYDSVLYAGCDVGVFYTTNLGINWNVLGSDLPNSPVHDLSYHQPTKKLIAATHGRSMFEFDLIDLLTSTDRKETVQPYIFELEQNYPNPFNSITKIKFSISSSLTQINQKKNVMLKVFNVEGKQVAQISKEVLKSGSYEIEFNADKFNLSSGVYFYNLTFGSISQTKKFVLIK